MYDKRKLTGEVIPAWNTLPICTKGLNILWRQLVVMGGGRGTNVIRNTALTITEEWSSVDHGYIEGFKINWNGKPVSDVEELLLALGGRILEEHVGSEP